MARVIYTGPLNPVIFARAKKEAEKAERIKGYTPRVIKTPSHTVVYSKTGPEVKAVVMDMLAPITFSIPGAAIPVAPNFLHLHPDLPENVYGKESKVIVNGKTDNGDFRYNGYRFVRYTSDGTQSVIRRLVAGGEVGSPAQVAEALWDEDDGDFPRDNFTSGEGDYDVEIGQIKIASTNYSTHSMCNTYDKRDQSDNGSTGFAIGEISLQTDIYGAFIANNIRSEEYGIDFKTQSQATLNAYFNDAWTRPGIHDIDGREIAGFSIDSFLYDDQCSAIGFNGSTLFSRLFISETRNSNQSYYQGLTASYSAEIIGSSKLLHQVSENLSEDNLFSMEVSSIEYSKNLTEGPWDYLSEVETVLNPFCSTYIAGSCDGFGGVFVKFITHDKWPNGEKIVIDVDSKITSSHLNYYFNIFDGIYDGDDAPHLNPPVVTTDGICLPHAWFFVRENETRQTDFYPNNFNRLSIVIYPQGRHEFSVDEAEIITVDLDHTPRFVARPGGAIAVSMLATNGGSASVPFTVSGLSQEFDDEGNPTGFYLADDGVLSESFTGSGVPVAFKLSPRQSLPAYRTVTVVAETEREHGVSACFEVLGDGVRVQPGPPVITLERISESVLSGQTSAFCLTATHMAYGSQLKYEVHRGEDVVNTGFVTIVNGAGIVEYTAPFRSLSAGGSPVKYVLADRLAPSATPSTVEYEFAIIHDHAPEPKRFSVRFAHEQYSSASDRPAALPLPSMFYMTPTVSANGEDDFFQSNAQTTLVQRVWYSLKSKCVYVLFWDGRSCDVSNVLKQNPESGQYEFNPDWKEVAFDYPPAAAPYDIKGTLEPYVYAYMDYENNLNNGA